MKRKYWIILGIVAMLIIASIITIKKGNKEEDVNLEKSIYTTIEMKTIENKQLISGSLSSNKEVNIKSELAGIIDAFYVEVGDEVKKGQAIAKIRTLPDPKSTQDASRQIQTAKINLERIKSNYDRNKILIEKEVISKQEFEISQQEYKISLNDLEAAKNYLKIVKQGFSNKSDFVSNVIYSTINGVVLDIPVKIGGSIQNRNTFSEGTTIAIIADVNEFIFKGQVNEKDLKHIKKQMQLIVKINALKNETYYANISKIAPKGIDVSGITRFDIEAKLNITSKELHKIKSGFTGTAEFLVEKAENVLSIEEKYIQFNLDTAFVYIKKGEDKERKIIKTGISDGQFIEIKSGLNKTDKVLKEIIKND